MNNEPYVTQKQHDQFVKEACQMAELTEVIDEIMEKRPELLDWFDDFDE